ncbi:MAG: ABC transporter permease subunit [Candidatus Fimivivens sp.]
MLRRLSEFMRGMLLVLCGASCFLLMAAIALLVLRFGLQALLEQLVNAIRGHAGASIGLRGLLPQLVNTVIICGLSLLLAMPAGTFCAVYLLYYSKGKRVAVVIETMLGALRAVPSAVYGLFGFFVFSQLMRLRYSVLSGILTMSVMLFAVAAGAAHSALSAVDDKLSKAALALGATKAEMLLDVIFSATKSGLMSAAVLCAAKTAGESAALLLTAGVGKAVPTDGWLQYFTSSGATLAVGLYQSVLEGEISAAFASALLLLLFTGFCSLLSSLLTRKKGKE